MMTVAEVELLPRLEVRANYLQMRKKRQEISVRHDQVEDYVENAGFEVLGKPLKTRTKLVRDWEPDVALENGIFCMLYEIEIEHICKNTRVHAKSAKGLQREIDVLAASEDAILVFEAKCFSETSRSGVTSDLLTALQERVSLVQQSVSRTTKARRKVVGVLVESNSNHGDKMEENAGKMGITILSLEEVRLYRDLSKSVGTYARELFRARIFSGKQLPSMKRKVPAILSRVGGYKMFTFVVHPVDLLKLAYVAHRTGRPSDNYQRFVKTAKIKSIRAFIDEGKIFPTNIVIAFDENAKGMKFDKSASVGEDRHLSSGLLTLPSTYGCAWVVDGQHRLLGYAGHPYSETAFVHVTAFLGLPKHEQAEMFESINTTQTKVSKDHLAELEALVHDDSPDEILCSRALASQVLQEMAEDPDSLLGSCIVTSSNKQSDTRCVRIGKLLDDVIGKGGGGSKLLIRARHGRNVTEYGCCWASSPSKLKRRLRTLLEVWFSEIAMECPDAWASGQAGLIASPRGITAMIKYLTWTAEAKLDDTWSDEDEAYRAVGSMARNLGKWWKNLRADELTSLRLVRGAGAPPAIVAQASCAVPASLKRFGGGELSKIKSDHLLGSADKINSLFRRAELACIKRLRSILIEKHGNEERAWDLGLEPERAAEAQMRWMQKIQAGEESVKWANLFFVDLKETAKRNWTECEEFFAIDGRGKTKGLDWMEICNKMRRPGAHGGGLDAKQKNIDYLERVLEALAERGFDTSGDTTSLDERHYVR